jgi:hypothetical protein
LLHRGMGGGVRRVGAQTSVSSSEKGWEQGSGDDYPALGQKEKLRGPPALIVNRTGRSSIVSQPSAMGPCVTPKRGTRRFRRHGNRAIRAARQPHARRRRHSLGPSDGCLVSPSRHPRRTCRSGGESTPARYPAGDPRAGAETDPLFRRRGCRWTERCRVGPGSYVITASAGRLFRSAGQRARLYGILNPKPADVVDLNAARRASRLPRRALVAVAE